MKSLVKLIGKISLGLIALILSLSSVLTLVKGNTSGADDMAYAMVILGLILLSILSVWLITKIK